MVIRNLSQRAKAAMPAPRKNTPLVRLGKFMADVEKQDPFASEFNPTVLEMFRRVTPNMNFGMKFVFSNLWLFKPLLKKLMPVISLRARPCCIPPLPSPWQRELTG